MDNQIKNKMKRCLSSFSVVALIFTVALMSSCNDDGTKVFTVKFNSNGGTMFPWQFIEAGGMVVKPAPDPAKAGFSFEGWFTDNFTFDNEWNFDVDAVTADFTLFAAWSEIPPTFTVTFDSNGGSAVATQTVDKGGKAEKPESDPERGRDIFEGWFTDNNTFADEWNFDYTINVDVVLFAKWTEIPANWVEITDDVLTNTTQPFATIGEMYTLPPDWWRAADWTVSDNLITNGSVSGGWRGFALGVMAFPGNTPLRQIINGKVYQTVDLDAGSYKFEAVLYAPAAGEIQVYVAAAVGSSLPDTNDVTQEALAAAGITAGVSGTVSFVFSISAKTDVSLGFVGNFNLNNVETPNSTFFSSFTLYKDIY